MNIKQLKYPIGEYISNKNPSKELLSEWINDIEKFPSNLMVTVDRLNEEQLNWIYRPEGWTIIQIIHHCADSHMNSYIRIKLAITENRPTIKPYYEEKWANLADSKSSEIDESITLLVGLHKKLVRLIKSLTNGQLNMVFKHPQHGLDCTVVEYIGVLAWHCNHHLEHIKNGIKSNGKYNFNYS